MSVEDLISYTDWEDFEINGERFFSARSALAEYGGLLVGMWYPHIYESKGEYDEVEVVIRIQTV